MTPQEAAAFHVPPVARVLPGPVGKLQQLASAGALQQATPEALGLRGPSSLLLSATQLSSINVHQDAVFGGSAWAAANAYAAQEAAASGAGTVVSVQQARVMTVGKLPRMLVVLSSFSPCGHGSAFAKAKDTTGVIGAAIHSSVLEEQQQHLLAPGCVLLLQHVSVLTPTPGNSYIAVTAANILKIWTPQRQRAALQAGQTPPLRRQPGDLLAAPAQPSPLSCTGSVAAGAAAMGGAAGWPPLGSALPPPASPDGLMSVLRQMGGGSDRPAARPGLSQQLQHAQREQHGSFSPPAAAGFDGGGARAAGSMPPPPARMPQLAGGTQQQPVALSQQQQHRQSQQQHRQQHHQHFQGSQQDDDGLGAGALLFAGMSQPIPDSQGQQRQPVAAAAPPRPRQPVPRFRGVAARQRATGAAAAAALDDEPDAELPDDAIVAAIFGSHIGAASQKQAEPLPGAPGLRPDNSRTLHPPAAPLAHHQQQQQQAQQPASGFSQFGGSQPMQHGLNAGVGDSISCVRGARAPTVPPAGSLMQDKLAPGPLGGGGRPAVMGRGGGAAAGSGSGVLLGKRPAVSLLDDLVDDEELA